MKCQTCGTAVLESNEVQRKQEINNTMEAKKDQLMHEHLPFDKKENDAQTHIIIYSPKHTRRHARAKLKVSFISNNDCPTPHPKTEGTRNQVTRCRERLESIPNLENRGQEVLLIMPPPPPAS